MKAQKLIRSKQRKGGGETSPFVNFKGGRQGKISFMICLQK